MTGGRRVWPVARPDGGALRPSPAISALTLHDLGGNPLPGALGGRRLAGIRRVGARPAKARPIMVHRQSTDRLTRNSQLTCRFYTNLDAERGVDAHVWMSDKLDKVVRSG